MTWKDFFAIQGVVSLLTLPLRVSPEKAIANLAAWWRIFR